MPLAERALIAEIQRMAGGRRRRLAGSGARIIAGIGDDCAVLRLPPGTDSLVTTDFSLEGIHFRRDWHPAESVGHRCLARGLSDIAAMGGDPAAAFLSLALPRDVPQAWVRSFIRGWMTLAKKYDVPLAGGDTAQSPNKILADIIVIGAAPKGKAVLRSAARAGDRIFVSGELGGSAAAVAELMAKPKQKLNPRDYPRHFYPEPRIKLGRILREKNLVSAMIDLSDGLSTDLAHICEENGVGAKIASALIPRARVGKPAREVAHDLALHGGEDYELLFTVPQGKWVPARIAGMTLTEIGAITRTQKILLQDENGVTRRLPAKGWEHFR